MEILGSSCSSESSACASILQPFQPITETTTIFCAAGSACDRHWAASALLRRPSIHNWMKAQFPSRQGYRQRESSEAANSVAGRDICRSCRCPKARRCCGASDGVLLIVDRGAKEDPDAPAVACPAGGRTPASGLSPPANRSARPNGAWYPLVENASVVTWR
jgi:hypothetical protein